MSKGPNSSPPRGTERTRARTRGRGEDARTRRGRGQTASSGQQLYVPVNTSAQFRRCFRPLKRTLERGESVGSIPATSTRDVREIQRAVITKMPMKDCCGPLGPMVCGCQAGLAHFGWSWPPWDKQKYRECTEKVRGGRVTTDHFPWSVECLRRDALVGRRGRLWVLDDPSKHEPPLASHYRLARSARSLVPGEPPSRRGSGRTIISALS